MIQECEDLEWRWFVGRWYSRGIYKVPGRRRGSQFLRFKKYNDGTVALVGRVDWKDTFPTLQAAKNEVDRRATARIRKARAEIEKAQGQLRKVLHMVPQEHGE